MLAALKLNKYPLFDMSEIAPERNFTFKQYQAIQPIKAGDLLPDFSLQKENARWQQFYNGAEVHGPVLLQHLFNKPLVIGFYSHRWQQHGLDLLKQLHTLQQDIRSQGGNLLIISSEKEKKLEIIAWENSLSLSFYFDAEKEIAEKFRIYSEHDPVWNKFSGVDSNVPLLATYVISPLGQIEYDHIDLNFSKNFPSKDITAAVQKAGSSHSNVRSITSY